LEHVQIHDTGNGNFHEEKGAVRSFFVEGAKYAAPEPAAVGTDLTTDMKRALITENYAVQKSLIVSNQMKHLHTEFLTNRLICICKVLNDG
jgi:hypothetical protein